MHADFMRISMDKKIHTLVAIKFEGHPQGIVDGGVLDHQLREIEVECLPLDVPEFLLSNIEHMEIGDSLHVSELTVDDKVTILTDPDRTIAAIHQPRVVKDETETAEGEEEGTDESGETTDDAGETAAE